MQFLYNIHIIICYIFHNKYRYQQCIFYFYSYLKRINTDTNTIANTNTNTNTGKLNYQYIKMLHYDKLIKRTHNIIEQHQGN